MVKRSLIGLVVLLALLVGAALVVPSFVDWNAYKDQIAREIEAATGRQLTIAGDVGLSLLPTPRLTAGQVSLSNVAGGQAPQMASLEALEVRVALAPLLSGDIQVQSLVLVAPTVSLERLADGRANWQFGTETAPETAAPETAAEDVTTRDTTASDQPAQPSEPSSQPQPAASSSPAIRLDSVSIEDGTVIYRDLATGTEERLEQLDAEISADSLQGPFEASGTAIARGQAVAFETRSGRLGDGAAPIALELALPEAGTARVNLRGSFDRTAQAFEGRLEAGGENLALLAEALAPGSGLPAQLAESFALSSDIALAGETLNLNDLQLTLGGTNATGDAEVILASQLDGQVALNVARLDLDDLLESPLDGGGGQAPAGGFVLPQDIALGFELIVDALVYKGQVVRQVLVSGRLAEGAVTLDQALALLPAGGDLSVSGRLTAEEGIPRFAGTLEGASDNLRGLAQWLELELPPAPNDRLRRASLSTAVDVTPARAQLSGLVLEIDSTTVQGGINLALGRAKPAFGAGLSVDRINLDAYLTGSGGGGGPDDLQVAQAEQATPETGEAQPQAANPLESFDANLNILVGNLTYGGQQTNDLTLQAQVKDADLTVQSLTVGDLVGGSASFAGVISGLPDNPEVADGQFRLEVPDTERLARLLEQPASGALAQLGSLSVDGTASGSLDAFGTDLRARIPEGSFAFAGQVSQPAGNLAVENGRLSLELSDTRRLAQIAGLADSPVARLGALQISGPLSGNANDLTLDLSGQALGGNIAAAGRVQQGKTLRLENLRVTAREVTGSRIADLIGPAADRLAGLGALNLATTMNGSPDGELSYDTTLGLLGGEIRGNGTASGVTGSQMSYSFDAAVDLPQLGRLLTTLGMEQTLRDGVGLNATARISGTPLQIQVGGLTGRLGPTDLAGETAVTLTGARPAIQATLQLGQIPLDRLLDDGLSGGGGQSPGRWSNEPLPLDALAGLNVTADVTAASISQGDLALSNATIPLRLENSLLQIDALTGRALGGNLRMALSLDARDPRAAGLDFDVTGTQLDSAQLAPSEGTAAGRVSGPIDLRITGNSLGASEAQLVGNLAGQGTVGGQITVRATAEEAVGNVLLGILGQQIRELRGLSNTVNAVFSAFAGTPAQLSGSFAIEKGVVRTSDLTLTGRDAVARGQGIAADLPAWTLDLRTDLYRGQERQPYLTALLSGSLDEPDVKVSGQPFQRGQQRPTTEDQAPSAPQQEPSPEDQLREQGEEILRGLFRNLQ
ncbi:AsmA family protein [Algihabitans albus]|uniref:AsmA family protein n=1 Tax=Algihabitans albus TaxID=2164067 RepID=UPI0013C2D7CA|nr:AsmA family protein [Algihabitans albus]